MTTNENIVDRCPECSDGMTAEELATYNDGTLVPEYDTRAFPDFVLLHLMCSDCEAEYPYDENRRAHVSLVENWHEAEYERAMENRYGW